ncbi:hypothetical protein CCHR01_09019 [Colletotrichum chrysophilum]|uniref:Uncharacterized protein n=1 Tax=Colletotrichum chrysophilum TaxID=1836956 RepID=A0AAD9AHU7_9PEZI|nr:hypothetical protein CCHR01_09019 [Colletotrichum chrysophilum]
MELLPASSESQPSSREQLSIRPLQATPPEQIVQSRDGAQPSPPFPSLDYLIFLLCLAALSRLSFLVSGVMRGGEARGKIVNDDNLQRRGYNGTSVFPLTVAAEPVTSPQPVVGRPTATASANGPGVVRWRPAGRYDLDLTPPQTGNTQSRVAWTQTLLSRTRDLREKRRPEEKKDNPRNGWMRDPGISLQFFSISLLRT